MAALHRPRLHQAWDLNDTYGFICTFHMRHRAQRQHEPALNQEFSSRQIRTIRTCRHTLDSSLRCRKYVSTLHPLTPHSLNKTRSDRVRDQRRQFHDYFVTHLPSSSLHPDSRSAKGPHHKLPRSASSPHTPGPGTSPAAAPPMAGASRELTVVRIPLKSAKHHFGAANSRGQRPYNEDTYQAGTIEMPAFAKRAPISLNRSSMKSGANSGEGEATGAESASGDPQVFYFGVFDGHGGSECSEFLREDLHTYIEDAVKEFGLKSSLKSSAPKGASPAIGSGSMKEDGSQSDIGAKDREQIASITMASKEDVQDSINVPKIDEEGAVNTAPVAEAADGDEPVEQNSDGSAATNLQVSLVREWKTTVGGYFRRFRPDYFNLKPQNRTGSEGNSESVSSNLEQKVSLESTLMYSFLRADLDFVITQAAKPDPDEPSSEEHPLNKDEVFGSPSRSMPHGGQIGGATRFKGGSTASIAVVSTPTPTPFWHPATPSTMVVAHVGDTRILLCETSTGLAIPVTTNHHPSSPVEGQRLRRYAATFVTDSFGEERMSGLANTRSFGDMRSKRIGVSAEPELVRLQLAPAQYSFLVLMTDGVSGTLSDQEVVDVVKEAKTPEQGARDVVGFATEVSKDGDNATCLVVRLGGWERRSEGGTGSMGTKEVRDFRKQDATDPRSRLR